MSGALAMMMASAAASQVVLVNYAFNSHAGSGITIDKPTGVLAGDLLIAIVGTSSAVTWTGDTGWTEAGDYGSAPGLRVAWKIAGGSEPSDYTFDASSNSIQGGLILAYRNAAFNSAGSFAHSTGGANLVMPTLTMTADGLLLAVCIGDSAGRSFSAPSGMVSVAALTAFSPSATVFSQSVGAGATGSKTSSPSGGTTTGILIGIKGT